MYPEDGGDTSPDEVSDDSEKRLSLTANESKEIYRAMKRFVVGLQ